MVSRMKKAREWAIRIAEIAAFALVIIILGELILSRSLYKETKFNGSLLSELEEPVAGMRVLVFAPHEDDELLGAGVYIQRALEAGADVTVCLITNGEYPEASMFLQERSLSVKPSAFINYGYQRQGETLKALETVGLDDGKVIYLGYPDHTVNQLLSPYHWAYADALVSPRTKSTMSPYSNSLTPSAPHAGKSLFKDIMTVLSYVKPDVVIVTNPYDVHIDHWATYAFVKLALSGINEDWAKEGKVRLLTYLVHRPDWPTIKSRQPAHSLVPPKGFAGLTAMDWLAFPSTISETLLKNKALSCYRSQLPSFSTTFMSFVRANELFCKIPDIKMLNYTDKKPMVLDQEPVADNSLVIRNPSADISGMLLSFHENWVNVEISFVKPPSRSVNMEIGFAIGSIGGGITAGGLKLSSGSLSGAYSSVDMTYYKKTEISSFIEGSQAIFSFILPDGTNMGWMLLWARSYIGLKFIDQTMIHLIRLTYTADYH